MGELVLITGGARSGKSTYALERCEDASDSRCFVATCPVVDSEMTDRIVAHQEERQGRGWHTIEEELQLSELLGTVTDHEVVLIDCLTLWVNNLLYAAQKYGKTFAEPEMRTACDTLLQAIGQFPGTVFCVTNEVGMGIVPDNSLARKYRDLVGSCNRYLARKATEVILVSCGIPLVLKGNGQV